MYANLQLELEVVGYATEAFTGADASFQIYNVQVKADLVQLDLSLGNSYAEHLLSGKSLPNHFQRLPMLLKSLQTLTPTSTYPDH